jgi:hypothetical protein
VVEVVAGLLCRLGGDAGQPLVLAAGQRSIEQHLIGGEKQQLADGDREVAGDDVAGRPVHRAIRQLDQQTVAELLVVAQVGQVILAGARQLPGVRQQQASGAELVQRDVGQRDVLLHLRRPGTPLGQPLRGDEGIVTQPEQIVVERRGGVHRCGAPSGTV